MRAAILIAALFLTSCASVERAFMDEPTLVIRKGCLEPDFCLVTLIVPPASGVHERCLSERALGCKLPTTTRVIEGVAIEAVIIVRGREPDRSATEYELDAHEACHALADVQDLARDPCHDEDGGVISDLQTRRRRA